MRKKKTLWKKAMSVMLSLTMTAGLLPVISKPLTVKAADNAPSSIRFATQDVLTDNEFNLNGGTVQKVNFGHGGTTGEEAQTWYIAGYDSSAGNLVLMCDPDMPLLENLNFCYAYPDPTFLVSDSKGLGIETCTYKGQVPTKVGMSHYGLSQLRTEFKEIEKDTEIFSAAEQGLMEDTTIYTYDRLNGGYYSTTDKLYAAHEYIYNSSYYLIVGQNSERFPDRGLKISLASSSPYYSAASFWLRTPFKESDNKQVWYKSAYGGWCSNGAANSVSCKGMPAFALDVSNVLFASAVPVQQEADAEFVDSSSYSMTFRLDDNTYNKIKSTVDFTDTGVKVTKKTDASKLYLCAQGKDETGNDWYFSKKITSTTSLSFAEIGHGASVSSKIWIETTDDNVTYAKMAENIVSPKASVPTGTYTANQSVVLTTTTAGAVMYYTTDGTTPDEDSILYSGAIPVTGKQGETVKITIKAITIAATGETSMVTTYRYTINLPHVHSWSTAWVSDSNAHWHECAADNCTVTSNSGKGGYAAHTADGGTITTQPTKTSAGVKTYKCSVCGYVMRTETIPATGSDSSGNTAANPEVKPAAKNTTLTVTSAKCKVKVTSSSATNPTVAYTKSTNSKATSVTIPATVTVNGVTYKVTSIAASAFANNKKITKVTIGKNVTSIGKNAFKKCTKLKTVTVKSTVLKSIGTNAFYGDKNLKTMTIKSTKLTSKTVGKNAFKGTNSKLTIKVPSKKVAAYKKFLKKKGNTKVTVKKG